MTGRRDPKVCGCLRPVNPTVHDRLHCATCDRPTAHGQLPPIGVLLNDIEEAAYLLGRVAAEYRWAYDLAHDPTRRNTPGAGHGHGGDPTGAIISDEHRQETRALTVIAARRVDNAVLELRSAWAALGEAIQAQELPGPAPHVQAAYHDPATLIPGRPDLANVFAAQERRHARGER